MPTVSGGVVASTASTLDYELRIMVDPGTQLKSFTVQDTMGMIIDFEPALEPCTSEWYMGRSLGIVRDRFPLSVEVTDCDDHTFGPDEFPKLGVLPTEPGIPLPCSALMCADNPVCREAQRNAVTERNRVAILCWQVQTVRDEFTRYLVIAAAAAITFILALAIAGPALGSGWIGAIIAAIFFAIAAAFFAIFVWATVEAARKRLELNQLEDRLRGEKNAYINDSLRRVFDACCPGCIDIDTSMPC